MKLVSGHIGTPKMVDSEAYFPPHPGTDVENDLEASPFRNRIQDSDSICSRQVDLEPSGCESFTCFNLSNKKGKRDDFGIDLNR